MVHVVQQEQSTAWLPTAVIKWNPTQSSHCHGGFPGGPLRMSSFHGSIRHSLGSSFKSVVQGEHRRSHLQESRHSGHRYSDLGPCRNGHHSSQLASAPAVGYLGGWSKGDGRSGFVCMGCWSTRSYLWNWFPRDFRCSVGLHHSTKLQWLMSLRASSKSCMSLDASKSNMWGGKEINPHRAQHAKGIHGFVTWLEESPPIIESLVFQDAMYLSLP